MVAVASVKGQCSRSVVAAFIVLAILAGPASNAVFLFSFFALHWQTAAGEGISYFMAGLALLLLGVVRRQPMLSAGQWSALLLLLLPQWLLTILTATYIGHFPWLHATRPGTEFLLSLAAPLWLGLLTALQLVQVEVPRAAIGASIAGIGAACLVIPLDAYGLKPNQIPVLLVQVLLNILAVSTWAHAVPRLAGVGALAAAGSFLLLCALGNCGLWLFFERNSWEMWEWSGAAVAALLIQTALAAGIWWLWFWLLQRMTLAAFGMRPLAGWTATMIPGLLAFGFMSWRLDVALAISTAAIVVALGARVAEEQPVALGLGAS